MCPETRLTVWVPNPILSAVSDKEKNDAGAHRNAVVVAWIGVTGAVVAAIIGGIFTVLGSRDHADPAPTPPTVAATTEPASPSASPTVELDVQLTAKSIGARAVRVDAKRQGDLPVGHELWFVLLVHRATGAVEYYPRRKLDSADATLQLTIPKDADPSAARTGQVYDVDDRAVQKRLAIQAENNDAITDADLLVRPCYCALGSAVTLPFTG